MRAGANIKRSRERAKSRNGREIEKRARVLALADAISYDDLPIEGRREYLERAVQAMEFRLPVARSIKTRKRGKKR